MISKCPTCQKQKKSYKKYGKLPPKEAEDKPWERVCMDLIGPCTIHRKGRKTPIKLKAIAAINPATGWFEIAECDDKRAITIANIFEQIWLSRCPRPS